MLVQFSVFWFVVWSHFCVFPLPILNAHFTWGTVLTVLCVTLWLHFGWYWSNLKGEPLSECVKSPGNQWLTVGISPHQGHLANFSMWKSCRTIKRCEKERLFCLFRFGCTRGRLSAEHDFQSQKYFSCESSVDHNLKEKREYRSLCH